MAPSTSSHSTSQSSSSSIPPNTIDYTLDHSRAHDPKKPQSAGELTISADTKLEAQDAMRSCALQILEQPLNLLKGGVIGDKELSAVSKSVAGSTVGKHLRHVLDHFRLFLDQVEGSLGNQTTDLAVVDYDRRARSVPIETSVEAAYEEFSRTRDRIANFLSSPNGSILDRSILLHATTPILQEFTTTIGRELWFITLHSIHHYALARVILNELGVAEGVSKEFGVAPSTLVYRQWGKRQDPSDSPKAKL
ncbi:unnamed protein product [Sympodiomycopsis kandeliae]